MIVIDGRIAVSICGLGENSTYSYALVVRPDTILSRGSDCYYYDFYGQGVFFDELEYGQNYLRKESLVLLPYTLLETLYGEVEGESGWVEADDIPFSEAPDKKGKLPVMSSEL